MATTTTTTNAAPKYPSPLRYFSNPPGLSPSVSLSGSQGSLSGSGRFNTRNRTDKKKYDTSGRDRIDSQQIRKMLHDLDSDGDDHLNVEDIIDFLRKKKLVVPAENLGFPISTIESMFDEADYDKNGLVGIDELLKAVSGRFRQRLYNKEWKSLVKLIIGGVVAFQDRPFAPPVQITGDTIAKIDMTDENMAMASTMPVRSTGFSAQSPNRSAKFRSSSSQKSKVKAGDAELGASIHGWFDAGNNVGTDMGRVLERAINTIIHDKSSTSAGKSRGHVEEEGGHGHGRQRQRLTGISTLSATDLFPEYFEDDMDTGDGEGEGDDDKAAAAAKGKHPHPVVTFAARRTFERLNELTLPPRTSQAHAQARVQVSGDEGEGGIGMLFSVSSNEMDGNLSAAGDQTATTAAAGKGKGRGGGRGKGNESLSTTFYRQQQLDGLEKLKKLMEEKEKKKRKEEEEKEKEKEAGADTSDSRPQFVTAVSTITALESKLLAAQQRHEDAPYQDPSTAVFRTSSPPRSRDKPDFVVVPPRRRVGTHRSDDGAVDHRPLEVLLREGGVARGEGEGVYGRWVSAIHIPDKDHEMGTGKRIEFLEKEPYAEAPRTAYYDRAMKQVLKGEKQTRPMILTFHRTRPGDQKFIGDVI